MNNYKVLIADDEAQIREILRVYFQKEGFQVLEAENGQEALERVEADRPDILLLDIMMPVMDGLQVCEEVRRKYDIPIIMLTAKDDDDDRILGLETGADDYITKPFNPVVMIARVKAQLRRVDIYSKQSAPQADAPLTYLDLTLYPEQHRCMLSGKELHVTPTEFGILEILLRNLGKPVSADAIFQALWKDEYFDKENNTITVHIRRLRDKMGEDYHHPRYIQTVWGIGYKIGECS